MGTIRPFPKVISGITNESRQYNARGEFAPVELFYPLRERILMRLQRPHAASLLVATRKLLYEESKKCHPVGLTVLAIGLDSALHVRVVHKLTIMGSL